MAILGGPNDISTLVSGGLGGGSSGDGRDFIDLANPLTDGTINSFNIRAVSGTPDVIYKIWRPEGANYRCIYVSSIFSNIPAGSIQSVGSNLGIAVQEGDFQGVHISSGSTSIGMVSGVAGDIGWNGGSSNYVLNDTAPSSVFASTLTVQLALQAEGEAQSGPTLTIISPNNTNRVHQRNTNNQFAFPFICDITNPAANSVVEYSRNGADWLMLDNNPTTTASGNVTVTAREEIFVRLVVDGTPQTPSSIVCGAAMVIAVGVSQSNGDGRLDNNQPVSLNTNAQLPFMLKSGVFSDISDPTGDTGTSAGSLWPLYASLIANQYPDAVVCIVNLSEGGTSIDRWLKSANDLYPRLTAAAVTTEGFEYTMGIIGEQDAFNAMPEAEATTKYGQVVDDLHADFGTQHYFVDFPSQTWGVAGDAMRAAFDAVILNNVNANFGGDLQLVDVASGSDPIHIKSDVHAAEAVQLMFDAVHTSNVTLALSGMPDGAHIVDFYRTDGSHIQRDNIIFSTGAGTSMLGVRSGENYRWVSFTPSVTPTHLVGDVGVA